MTIQMNMIGQQTAAAESCKEKTSAAAKEQLLFSVDGDEKVTQDDQSFTKTVNRLQNISDILGRKIQFKVNQDLQKVVIKIIDPSTDKVIKEIPSAEIQQLQIRMREALGLLIDESI